MTTVSITTNTAGLTLNYSIVATSGLIASINWAFGDGNSTYGSYSGSHTYAIAGTYTVLITWVDGEGNEKGTTRSITVTTIKTDINDPVKNVFSDKPLYLPPECTGDVRITANITKLSDTINYAEDSKTSAWTASINFDSFSISGGSSYELYVDPGEFESHDSDQYIIEDDKKIKNLEFIPAFYNYGTIATDIRMSESDDDDSNFDVKCGLEIQFPSYPDWYEGTLTYGSSVTTNLISSDNSETKISSTSPGVSNNINFTMNTWSGMPPVEVKYVVDYNKDTTAQTAISRACLSNPQFKFTLTNNLSSSVTLSNVSIKFNFYYNENGLLMNTRTEGAKSKEFYQLFTLPKGAEENRITTLNYPLFGVIDGYKLNEVVRVYGYYDKWDSANSIYFPSCLTLYPIEETAGSDHPPVVYKSYINTLEAATSGITEFDFERLAYKGLSTDDYCKVLTPQILAADDHYRTINVKCKDPEGNYGYSPDSYDAIFELNTVPNTSIDEVVTTQDLTTYIEKINFFNTEMEFAQSVSVNRADIDPVFYERLYTTYKSAPVLQSIFGEALYFVYFTINDYGSYFPIKHGETLEFSENLIHAPNDGVSSNDIFVYSNTEPNQFGIVSPTKYKYKVKFKYSYDVYQDAYAVTADDLKDTEESS